MGRWGAVAGGTCALRAHTVSQGSSTVPSMVSRSMASRLLCDMRRFSKRMVWFPCSPPVGSKASIHKVSYGCLGFRSSCRHGNRLVAGNLPWVSFLNSSYNAKRRAPLMPLLFLLLRCLAICSRIFSSCDREGRERGGGSQRLLVEVCGVEASTMWR